MRAVTSGLSSFGMPTHTTVRPPSASMSIIAPARLAYSTIHVSFFDTGSFHSLGFEPSAVASPWPSLPPNVTTTICGCSVGRVSARWAGQSKKSGRASPDDTL